MKEMVGGCCVCSDEMGWHDNPLIYCDGPGCEVAVHQGCYGIQEVPDGEWFCEKCRVSTSFDSHTRVNGLNGKSKPFRCELCPLGDGALKRTESGGWAHVVCALYIPEARFGDVHTMDPVILSEIPPERFNRTCYICAESSPKGKMGACMECHRPACKKYFHVTCAQQKGLLCEETGISKTVKYCGFCHHHIKKGIADPSIKAVPPLARSVVDQPTPPNSNNSGHMLVDPIHRPETINTVLGLSTTEDGHLVNNFSPPLTTSSRSSVALDSTPPLSTPQNPVGVKVEMKAVNGTANSSNSLNALMTMGQNHNRLAEPVEVIPVHERNGHVDVTADGVYASHATTPSVSRPPIAVKRPRELLAKTELMEKAKKPRVNHKKPNNMKSGEIDEFQALLDAVGPVVSETVSDFQRERVAGRSEAERRATQVVAQPSTSTAHEPHHETTRIYHPAPNVPSTSNSHAVGSSPSTSRESTLPSSMEALLERQWDQGAQLLLGQAQFDVSQLLTCLHQLKQENSRLEEQLISLTKRREHLLALNARLAVPLTSEPSHPQRHIHSHNNTLNTPHHSPHVPPHSAPDEMNQIRSLASNRLLAQRPSSQANVAPSMPTFVTPQSRPPVSAAPVPSAPISTTPTSQNTASLPTAVPPQTVQDLANISPERLAAALAPMGLQRNFNLSQNPLIPMNDIMAQLMLHQIGNANRFNSTGTNSLFLGNMMPTLNGPTGQNGGLSK